MTYTRRPSSAPRRDPQTRPHTLPVVAAQPCETDSAAPPALPNATPEREDAPPVLSGVKPVLELLERDPSRVDLVLVRKGRRTPETDRILDICRASGVRFCLSDAAGLDRLCTAGHQGVVARLFEAGFVEFSDLLRDTPDAPLPLMVALDQVQDTGNAGTLARTLYALGGAGLIVPRHNGVYLGAGARRAAAGALELLPVARVVNLARALDEARDAGYIIYGAAEAEPSGLTEHPDLADRADRADEADRADVIRRGAALADSVFASPLHLPAVLVLGSEEHGLRPQVRKRCDHILSVPMLRTFDSLNVAQAGAVLLGCFLRTHLGKH